jgi:hypothetical protein
MGWLYAAVTFSLGSKLLDRRDARRALRLSGNGQGRTDSLSTSPEKRPVARGQV